MVKKNAYNKMDLTNTIVLFGPFFDSYRKCGCNSNDTRIECEHNDVGLIGEVVGLVQGFVPRKIVTLNSSEW